jgi:hypothetical protein
VYWMGGNRVQEEEGAGFQVIWPEQEKLLPFHRTQLRAFGLLLHTRSCVADFLFDPKLRRTLCSKRSQ